MYAVALQGQHGVPAKNIVQLLSFYFAGLEEMHIQNPALARDDPKATRTEVFHAYLPYRATHIFKLPRKRVALVWYLFVSFFANFGNLRMTLVPAEPRAEPSTADR